MFIRFRRIIIFGIQLFGTSLILISCNKLVQIAPPTTAITTSEVFADSADATAQVMGIYTSMVNSGTNLRFANGALTCYGGLSSDELQPFLESSNSDLNQLYTNSLISTNGFIEGAFFMPAYQIIYKTNACLEGVQASTGLSPTAKKQFRGEAEFIRAFCYFYLVNLFGDVPFVTSTDWAQTNSMGRTPKAQIYAKLIADLIDAKNSLAIDYSLSRGERTRANSWAASALLARVYLFTSDWTNAEKEATNLISNSGLFTLDPDLNSVFLANNAESILQWNLNTNFQPFNATIEGFNFIPRDSTNPPSIYINSQLLDAFEVGDQRRKSWIDTISYQGLQYLIPYKYKIGPSQSVVGATATEYYTVLRLAEIYLIRAEAEANGSGDGINGAINDLNKIRSRAGLQNYIGPSDKKSILNAIYHERQIELFAECGHRWLDLKRTGQIDGIMSIVTPQKNGGGTWQSYQQLYPIPISELTVAPNLKQNQGY